MNIRDADKSDIPFIVAEGIKFLKHHPCKFEQSLDIDHLNALAENLITNHTLLVAEQEGQLVGMIAGILVPNIYNKDYIGLQEMFWWVVEEARTSSAAIRLYGAFEERAKDLEVDFISMVSTVYTPTLENYYKKQGYKPVETSYIKEL
jgi:N-acetylglutamate synthase-like GNAT family acetyltransferase